MAAQLTALLAELAKLDALIDAELTAGRTFDWTVGHVKINNTSKLKTLYEQRSALWKHIQERCPTEVIESVVTGIDKFGEELVEDGV